MAATKFPFSPEQLSALPPEFQGILRAVIDYYEGQLAELKSEIIELKAEVSRLRKTPQNSSLPPSSQHPHAKSGAQQPKSPRKPGGQPGHPRHERALIASEECQRVVTLRPTACRRCGARLAGDDPAPLRHQVSELPQIELHVTEYQRHRLECPSCGATSCGSLPAGVPTIQAGPRLVAFVALLMGNFRQSKRRVATFLEQVLDRPCSPGWIVKLQNQATAALRPTIEHLAAQLPQQAVLGIDESPTKQGRQKSWLWTFVGRCFTVFALRPTRAATVLDEHLGPQFPGTIQCDRARMYFGWPNLQWCWAHLKRDFQALVDSSDGQQAHLGRALLRQTQALFGCWARYRDGTLGWSEFQARMRPIRRDVEALLLRGLFSGNARLQGLCRELHTHRAHLWRFTEQLGVEPTNNLSERALRPAVIWRKLSFGTQSAAGSRFVETLLTVVETCRQQRRAVFALLVNALTAHFNDAAAPQLATA